MDLAPSVSEQVGLYVELFSYAALSIVLFLAGIILNWKVAKDVGAAVARLAPPQLGGLKLQDTVAQWLQRWQDEFRRVKRTITFLFAVAFLANAFAMSTIIAVAGQTLRGDNVVSEWQRWAAYTFGMILTTAAMAQYYALETVATWIFALIPAGAGMLMGVFVSLTSKGSSGGVPKMVLFSIWGPIFLLALIPLFYIYTTYNILRKWWRGFPIVVHVFFAIGLWIVLWASPEVASGNTPGARTAATWAYFVILLLWYLVMLFFVYFWVMGRPKPRTSATDAIILNSDYQGGGAATNNNNPRGNTGRGRNRPRRVVNLDPRSPNFASPATRKTGPPNSVQGVRGQLTVRF